MVTAYFRSVRASVMKMEAGGHFQSPRLHWSIVLSGICSCSRPGGASPMRPLCTLRRPCAVCNGGLLDAQAALREKTDLDPSPHFICESKIAEAVLQRCVKAAVGLGVACCPQASSPNFIPSSFFIFVVRGGQRDFRRRHVQRQQFCPLLHLDGPARSIRHFFSKILEEC